MLPPLVVLTQRFAFHPAVSKLPCPSSIRRGKSPMGSAAKSVVQITRVPGVKS